MFSGNSRCLLYPVSDDENTTEHTPTHHMLQPPQSVFPACICAAVLPIVHLMEDGDVREDGVAGGEPSETPDFVWMLFGFN